MRDSKAFADTNIVVYAYDTSAGEKHHRALGIMKDLWNSGHGIISTQVLQEFYVTITMKTRKPLRPAVAKTIVKDLMKWKTVIVDEEIILKAVDIQMEHKYSFWDSAIIASALEGGADMLLSEDLADKQKIKGIVIKNPFAHD